MGATFQAKAKAPHPCGVGAPAEGGGCKENHAGGEIGQHHLLPTFCLCPPPRRAARRRISPVGE